MINLVWNTRPLSNSVCLELPILHIIHHSPVLAVSMKGKHLIEFSWLKLNKDKHDEKHMLNKLESIIAFSIIWCDLVFFCSWLFVYSFLLNFQGTSLKESRSKSLKSDYSLILINHKQKNILIFLTLLVTMENI